jgi:hypothetical protein
MKTVGGILALLMLVTVIAVNGSRAGPLPATGAAFRQCLGEDAPSDGRCAPAGSFTAGVDEVGAGHTLDQVGYGDFGQARGGDLSAPEFWSEIHRVVFLENVLVRMALDYFFGRYTSPGPTTAHTAALIFDPVR